MWIQKCRNGPFTNSVCIQLICNVRLKIIYFCKIHFDFRPHSRPQKQFALTFALLQSDRRASNFYSQYYRFIDAVQDTKQFLCKNRICLCPNLKTPQNLNYKQDTIQIPFLKNSLQHRPFVIHVCCSK